MSKYKGYDPTAGKKATMKYKKTKQHRIEVAWKNEEFEDRIQPAIEKSGLPIATYIKKAVNEKIERDNSAND